MRTRHQPHVGDEVRIVYLAAELGGVVEMVEDDGRQLVVAAGDGSRIGFRLNPATGRFMEGGQLSGARLVFVSG